MYQIDHINQAAHKSQISIIDQFYWDFNLKIGTDTIPIFFQFSTSIFAHKRVACPLEFSPCKNPL